MRRTQYNLRGFHHNATRFGAFTPAGYYEVVPGDTMQGNIKFTVMSDPTDGFVLNPAYYDAYAFYVPYRLLDSTFPDLIKDPDSASVVPTVTDLFEVNFEHAFTLPDRDWETSSL